MDNVSWSPTFASSPLKEVGLTQNQETLMIQPLTTIGWSRSIMKQDPHK